MAEYLVIATSLNPESKSRLMAAELARVLSSHAAAVELVDLQTFPLPICDGGAAYSDPNVGILGRKLREARVIFLATPIYNYDANAAAKNLVELTGDAWEDKIVGFLCAAGGASSYMSIMALANSLMLDFRCVILPRFVYATGRDFSAEAITNPAIADRIADLAKSGQQLRSTSAESG
jgi:NAD(P)H-dependent FMN reductase